jgi:hypothetical protein
VGAAQVRRPEVLACRCLRPVRLLPSDHRRRAHDPQCSRHHRGADFRPALTQPSYQRTQEVINTTIPCPRPSVVVQAARRRHVTATSALRSCVLARAWSHTRTGRATTDALAAIPTLCDEIDRLTAVLDLARRHHQDLTAAARASLTAATDGELDPLYYLRDELRSRGQLPDDSRERPW